MALIAIIPPGVTEIKVNGLHQWDYGQELEIHCDEIPAIVEVHFACFGMIEADVRTCTVANGVAKVSIPDICIEQTTPITAWVYCIDGTSARTAITITLPIISRAKPAPSASVPTFISDKYTELVSAINEQVGALQNGDVMAARARAATTAESANHSNTAGHANSADTANSAGSATNATNATNATHATNADKASTLVLPKSTITIDLPQGIGTTPEIRAEKGLYLVILDSGKYDTGILYLDPRFTNSSSYVTCGRYYINYDEINKLVQVYDFSNTRVGNSFTLYLYKLGEANT